MATLAFQKHRSIPAAGGFSPVTQRKEEGYRQVDGLPADAVIPGRFNSHEHSGMIARRKRFCVPCGRGNVIIKD